MKTIGLVFPIALAVFSCTSEITDNDNFTNHHSAQNSLDWSGVYSGTIPCADCEGIEMTLRLTQDLEYSLMTRYIGKSDEEFNEKGQFIWQGHNIEIKRNDKQSELTLFKVEENQLRMLDTEGNRIEGNLSDNYILKKEGNAAVENKRWRLVELEGLQIAASSETHYIIFHGQDNTIEAKANCNRIQFEYKIRNEYQLSTKAGLTTLMGCPDDTEDRLKNAILKADNISVTENRLTLNKARMAPLAVFEIVD